MRSFWLLLLALATVVAFPALAAEQADREFHECPDCPQMVGIPAGTFAMGSPASEAGRFDAEGPQHYVTVKAFALGKFPVTSEEFLIFLRDSAYQPKPCNPMLNLGWRIEPNHLAYPPTQVEPPDWPAVCLDWNDANAYIAWLNAKVRKSSSAKSGPYRLPSEAEWEYAARGGTATARWWGNDLGSNNANCNGCGSQWDYRVLAGVNSFRPNPFGLYGMLGNAWQWTEDCWHPSYVGAPANGSAWKFKDCPKHVIRGGSWDNVPLFVRSAARSGAGPNGGEYDYSSLSSFRVARDLP